MRALTLLTALVALLPWAALAADTMPVYDPVRACTEAARRAGARDNAAPPDCIRGEIEARDGVARVWAELPAGARSRCIRLADRRRSFLILSSCVEREVSGAR